MSVVAITGCAVAADRLEIGVLAEYPITKPFTLQNAPYFNDSFDCGAGHAGQACGLWESAGRRPMLGISVLVPITRRIALRASPLYQRLSWSSQNNVPFVLPGVLNTDTIVITANRWEVPVSARWRFTEHINAGVGGTLSTLTGEGTLDMYAGYSDYLHPYSGTANLRLLSNRTIWGATTGVEFPFHTRIAVIAPDVEYTRWASGHYAVEWPRNRLTVGIALRFAPRINFR